uniref:Uncharacterized protein n=1 Tax=Arundo donax TaxID=35708 RepID=A0A0A9HTV5_ARUDO
MLQAALIVHMINALCHSFHAFYQFCQGSSLLLFGIGVRWAVLLPVCHRLVFADPDSHILHGWFLVVSMELFHKALPGIHEDKT